MDTEQLPRVYFSHLRDFIKKYERHVGVLALISGFLFDSLTLIRPDKFLENLILLMYFFISAGGILFLAIYERWGKEMPILVLPMVQFSFGNLAGGLMVLYGRSGTIQGNYLFFILFLLFIIGNEFLRSHYARINFNISAWYFLFLAYSALVVPIVLGKLGVSIFLLSTVFSLIVVVSFLYLIFAVSRGLILVALKKIFFSISAIFVLFNALYFLNIIPPVPLSLREIGIYHSIVRTDTNYEALYEKPSWFEFLHSTSKTFTYISGEKGYCFSSVFVPTGIATSIYHRWEYYDEVSGKWQTSSLVSFSIVGGRDNGYRGYSEKSAISAGKWRCSVETRRRALIGRITFNVVDRVNLPKLSQKNL